MLQLGLGTLRIMDMETGEDLGAINEIPELTIENVDEPIIIGVDLCNNCEGSITVEFEPKSTERLVRIFRKGTNNWRKRHHIPMMRKIYRR